jgi:hypothetical protein
MNEGAQAEYAGPDTCCQGTSAKLTWPLDSSIRPTTMDDYQYIFDRGNTEAGR